MLRKDTPVYQRGLASEASGAGELSRRRPCQFPTAGTKGELHAQNRTQLKHVTARLESYVTKCRKPPSDTSSQSSKPKPYPLVLTLGPRRRLQVGSVTLVAQKT